MPLRHWLLLVLFLVVLAGATAVLFGSSIHDLYVSEFVAPQLQQDLGFRIGKIKMVDDGREHEVAAIVAVEPHRPFHRAGFRPGDVPVGYVHGFVGFYHHLNDARGGEATIRVMRPEDASLRDSRAITVAVPDYRRLSSTSRIAPSDEIQVYRRIRAMRVGVTEQQVLDVAGMPLRSENAPFPSESLPMKPGCKACEATSDCRLLPAVRRAHYEWRMRQNRSTTKIEGIALYYDAANVVTCTQRTIGMEMHMTWSH